MIKAVLEDNPKCDYLMLYKGKQFIQRLNLKKGFNPMDFSEPMRVADINGDSLNDLKLVTWYHGCGLASMNVNVLYLFQQPGNKFAKVEFLDKTDPDNTSERDMDGDGNYEIITMDLKSYKTHNYWVFNIYNFKNNELVNGNEKFDYPVMVQYLFRQNFKPAKFNKNIRNKYSLKHPPEYDVSSCSK